MTEVTVALPPKLRPVFLGPADVRGAYGGRGSGKTRSFAKMAAVRGMMYGTQGVSGQILCARQYMNSLDDSSLEEVKRAIEEEEFLAAYWNIGEKFIKSRDGRVDFTFAGLDRSINSVKSKGRILVAWVDEAEPVTDHAWSVLIPTLREEGGDWNAELWVTWNPMRKTAAVEKRFRNSTDPLVKIAEINWSDNPKFPATLERARQRDLAERPEQYPHVWDGAYATVVEGAYYAKQLIEAKHGGRIGRVGPDPLMTYRAVWDIGGTGAKADAVSVWVCQFVGKEVRVVNHYAARGQELAEHVKWLRDNGYEKALCVLPHDGAQNDKVHRVSYESALREAGFSVIVVPNMGQGAASMRIEAARRVFPQIWFNADTTEAGREALGAYHEKKHEQTGVGLGPAHDWASHDADSFGLIAVHYENQPASTTHGPVNYKRLR